jgi:predicted Zn-dependent protease
MNPVVRALAMLMALSVAGAASAQSLAPPGEVVIHVNSDVRSTEFVEPGRQFSPRKIAPRFWAATAGESELQNPFRYLILDHDLTVPQLNYVFAETYRPPLSVISVTRLAPTVAPVAAKKAAIEITLPRVYMLMLKSVAVMAGLRSGGCVMSFPKSLAELDAKPSEYCADDRAALVAAKVIKEIPSASCANVVASR